MTTFYYPIKNDNISSKKDEKYRFIEHINLIYYIEKSKIDELIRYIFTNYCGVSVFGYYKNSDVYWCKKNSKYSCDLHVEIQIIKKSKEYSHIKIIPLVGNDENIRYFVTNLHNSLQLYQRSNFIKTCFSRQRL